MLAAHSLGEIKVKQKVLAYLIREDKGKQQLLVFIHRDYPEAGMQVPGGTVEEVNRLKLPYYVN